MSRLFVLFIGLIIFFAGCAKEEPKELQFKNDVITIENYVTDNVAPYAGGKTGISFDIKNNGDKPVKWVKVNFFDTPGFEIESLDCLEFGQKINNPNEKGYINERSCKFGDPAADHTTLDVIDSLDTRSVKFTLKAPTNINSPTPFTVSFSVTYRYGSIQQGNTYFFGGERTALIPVIDTQFKKEPSSKFSQSEPTIGPILFEISPSLEREKIVDGKTIKEYWATSEPPLRSFQTKFILKKMVSEGVLKDIQPDATLDCKGKGEGCIEIQLTNLIIDHESLCDFNDAIIKGTSKKLVNEKNTTLVCSFFPVLRGLTPEFTSTINILYNYDYEIVRKQNFVVYPAIS